MTISETPKIFNKYDSKNFAEEHRNYFNILIAVVKIINLAEFNLIITNKLTLIRF